MKRLTAHKLSVYDVVAGISVALVLIPQALAYAQLAGMPAYVGLFAAILPTIIAAFFASSPYLQTGPVAMTALLTFGVLAGSGATTGSAEYMKLAAFLALMVGVIRVGLGLTGGGFIAYLMSQPVVAGFSAASAILISASQLPKALGVSAGNGGLLVEAGRSLTATWDWRAVTLSITTIILIVAGRKLHSLFPGVLVAMVVGIVYSAMSGYDGAIVGTVPTGLPPLSLDLPWSSFGALVIPALVIAIVGFAEPTAISRTFATMDRQAWNPDRELISQGVANLAAGLSSAFPVGGSFSRSSLARLAGARTRATGAIAGLGVLIFLPFAAVIEPLPSAVLGAIVIVSVFKLIDIPALLDIWKHSRLQGVVAATTFALTLALAPRIDRAVIVGTLLGIAVHLWREMRIDVASWTTGTVVYLSPRGVLYFGSAPGLGDRLNKELAAHPDATSVVIELQGLGRIDYTGAVALKQAVQEAIEADVTVELSGIPEHARRILSRVWEAGIPETVTRDRSNDSQ